MKIIKVIETMLKYIEIGFKLFSPKLRFRIIIYLFKIEQVVSQEQLESSAKMCTFLSHCKICYHGPWYTFLKLNKYIFLHSIVAQLRIIGSLYYNGTYSTKYSCWCNLCWTLYSVSNMSAIAVPISMHPCARYILFSVLWLEANFPFFLF